MEIQKNNPTFKPQKQLTFDFSGAKKIFGKYIQLQVDSINGILNECKEQSIIDINQVAYIFATAYHEGVDISGKITGTKMTRFVPVIEGGTESYLKSKKYYPYIGRGLVQLTWLDNYKKFASLIKSKFGVDIIKNPELLNRVDIACFVIVYGMKNGSFTNKKLADYINAKVVDFINARRIINGTDKKDLIAGYAKEFLKNLKYEL